MFGIYAFNFCFECGEIRKVLIARWPVVVCIAGFSDAGEVIRHVTPSALNVTLLDALR